MIQRVEDQPDDPEWQPTDIRHSMIYWNVADNLNFSGMAGPQVTDPRTRQVLKSNVYRPHDLTGTGAGWLTRMWLSRPIALADTMGDIWDAVTGVSLVVFDPDSQD